MTSSSADATHDVRVDVAGLWLDDLEWLLFSPELLWSPATAPLGWTPEQRQAGIAWLEHHRLARTPSPSGTASRAAPVKGPGRFMLGRYAEQLMGFYFANGPTHRLLAAGQQVRDAHGKVLGELDFLVEDAHSGELLHVELATKFFLRVGDQLIGPNAKEVMDAKVARLFRHQVALRLPEVYASASRRVMTRGVIYYRDKASRLDLAASHARGLAASHTVGRWVPVDELTPRASAWRVLGKDAWLRARHPILPSDGPASARAGATAYTDATPPAGEVFTRASIAELRDVLDHAPTCLLAFGEPSEGLWREHERITVVGPRFPVS